MAVGREPTDQTVEAKRPGYVTAVQGRDGRLAVPPKGDLYVRDPQAARAKAIRDRIALHKELKQPIPPHLQKLFDDLPDEDAASVDLVDAVSGEHVAAVELETAAAPEIEPESAVFRDGALIASKPAVPGPTGTVVDDIVDVEPAELVEVEPEVEPTELPSEFVDLGFIDEPAADAQSAAIARAAAVAEPEVVDVEEVALPEEKPVAHAGQGTLTATAEAVPAPPAPEPPKPAPPRPAPRKPAPRRK